jgi:predicted lipoprotein with Yx(FWY)xxD motif
MRGRFRHRRLRSACGLVAAFILIAGVAAAATAVSFHTAKRTVGGKPATIVVAGRGVTVYELGGESLAKLECVTRSCLDTWPPVKVSSAGVHPTAAAGVPGTVSVMHRVHGGFFQVMLDRHPLYYYSGDAGVPGRTRGQGIASFGGTWHVVKTG